MSYRPEGMEKNPYWVPPRTEDDMGREFRHKREGVSRGEAWEAGADAMLEGLKKDSFPVGHLISSVFLTNLPYDATLIEYEGKKGHLVFIPEE